MARRPLIGVPLRVLSSLATWMYGADGLNALFLFMPTFYIVRVLRRYGAMVEDDVRIKAPLLVHNGSVETKAYFGNLHIGSGCYLGRQLFLDLQDRIEIEANATLSHGVMLLTHTDAGNSPLSQDSLQKSQAPIVIGEGAYLGARVTVLQGVSIGERAIVAAGALVKQDVAPRTLVGGVPAKPLRGHQNVK